MLNMLYTNYYKLHCPVHVIAYRDIFAKYLLMDKKMWFQFLVYFDDNERNQSYKVLTVGYIISSI